MDNAILDLAERIARGAHEGQLDKQGKPYILHPRAVMFHVERIGQSLKMDEETIVILKAAAWLHDVLEDTDVTAQWLFEQGIPDSVIEIVEVLTRLEWELYNDYINRVARHPLARLVKLADLTHNLDPNRRNGIADSLEGRYLRARTTIIHAIGVVL